MKSNKPNISNAKIIIMKTGKLKKKKKKKQEEKREGNRYCIPFGKKRRAENVCVRSCVLRLMR